MCQTVQRDYRGWTITIRCSQRSKTGPPVSAPTFTAMADAELQSNQDPAEWIDPRMQIITTGNRSFESGAGCIDVLLNEVMQLIDALKR